MIPINLQLIKEFHCSCGRVHRTQIDDVIIESGAVNKLPEVIRRYQAKKAFVFADSNTYKAAGRKVCDILEKSNIEISTYIYGENYVIPDEKAVGLCVMNLDYDCEIIVAVGSGVINDIGKIVSHIAGKPYIIIATAPSMDGYASATSSIEMEGLKTSLPSTCANVIIGDIDVLKKAPIQMLKAGLGDMIAKYVSICEWRISHIITGEYYCETIADMVRNALRKCVDHSGDLLKRDDEAVKAVFEGLIISGIAMNYAGLSRPASGVEHYFSHIWDMRSLEFGTPMGLHGIQCAVATLIAVKLYEQLQSVIPNREKALQYAEKFDYNCWYCQLKEFLGKSADIMKVLEQKEHKYDLKLHAVRLEIILERWDDILKIIKVELPTSSKLEKLLKLIEAPESVEDMGIDPNTLPMTFFSTKDIRDKYVLSRLAWDLGIIDELKLNF